jgi:hypothetical protein
MQLKTQFNKRNGINARALVGFVFAFVIVNVFVVLVRFGVGFRVGFRVVFVVLVRVVITFVVLGGVGLGLMFANENIAVAVADCRRESNSFI